MAIRALYNRGNCFAMLVDLQEADCVSAAKDDDNMLVAAVLAGDSRRFNEIVRRYESALLRLARSRCGSVERADDIVQETFLCAFRSLATFDDRFSFRTWLWTIHLNQCRRDYRRHRQHFERRERMLSSSDRSDVTVEAAPDARLLADEREYQLQRLLQMLPPNQADALRLRFYAELKFHEIADTMRCSLSTAKNRVRWGLTKMSELMVHPSGSDC